MRITNYYYTCPVCKAQDGPSKRYQFRYGSPFRTCKRCKSNFINRNYHEIAVTGLPAAERNSLLFSLIVFCIALLVACLCAADVFSEETLGFALFIGAVCLIDIATSVLRVSFAMSASKKRVSDPEYRRRVTRLYRS